MTQDLPKNVMFKLKEYRDSIDHLDAELVRIISERFNVTRSVGKLKAEHNLPASDSVREEELIFRLRQLAARLNFDPDFTEKFVSFIIEEVVRQHEDERTHR